MRQCADAAAALRHTGRGDPARRGGGSPGPATSTTRRRRRSARPRWSCTAPSGYIADARPGVPRRRPPEPARDPGRRTRPWRAPAQANPGLRAIVAHAVLESGDPARRTRAARGPGARPAPATTPCSPAHCLRVLVVARARPARPTRSARRSSASSRTPAQACHLRHRRPPRRASTTSSPTGTPPSATRARPRARPSGPSYSTSGWSACRGSAGPRRFVGPTLRLSCS